MDVISFSKDIKVYFKSIEKKAFKRVKRPEKMAKIKRNGEKKVEKRLKRVVIIIKNGRNGPK
jgi:hypothetical protein